MEVVSNRAVLQFYNTLKTISESEKIDNAFNTEESLCNVLP